MGRTSPIERYRESWEKHQSHNGHPDAITTLKALSKAYGQLHKKHASLGDAIKAEAALVSKYEYLLEAHNMTNKLNAEDGHPYLPEVAPPKKLITALKALSKAYGQLHKKHTSLGNAIKAKAALVSKYEYLVEAHNMTNKLNAEDDYPYLPEVAPAKKLITAFIFLSQIEANKAAEHKQDTEKNSLIQQHSYLIQAHDILRKEAFDLDKHVDLRQQFDSCMQNLRNLPA